MREKTVVFCFVLVVAIGLCVHSADAESPAGVVVDWVADETGSSVGTLEVQWTRSADETTVGLRGPAEMSPPAWVDEVLTPGAFKSRFGAVLAGERLSLSLDLSGLKTGDQLAVAAQRKVADVAEQTVIDLRMQDDRVVVGSPRSYRISREGIDDGSREKAFNPNGIPMTENSSRGRVVIQPLAPKVQATVFGEDTHVYNIPDGPGDCADTGGDYPIDPIMSMDAAPPGSIITAMAVHVVISHNNMSQIHVAFSEDDYFWTRGGGLYLVKNDPGTNLDEVFTKDKYNNDLPGIGLEVNGWFSLWVRDCQAGVTGTLDYWSVSVDFDGGAEFDLVADSVTVSPDPAEPGAQVELSWAGHVEGTDSLAGSFDVGLYISPDMTITTADTELDRVTVNDANDPGDTFGESGPGHIVTIPGGLADGTYYVGIIVDPDNAQEETDEDNNSVADSLEVSEPDIDIVAGALTPQTNEIEAGGLVTVDWSGQLAADSSEGVPGGFSVGFYLSNDANVTTADVLLQQVSVPGPVNPGATFGEAARQLQIPAGTAAGSWTMGMILDDTGAVAERDEDNNIDTADVTITAADTRPDLEIRECSISDDSVAAGEQIDVFWERRNAGLSASGPFDIGIYLSSDTDFDEGSDVVLTSWQTGGWPAEGNWNPVSTAVTIPSSTAAGSYYVLIVFDFDDVVDETQEDDNSCAVSLTVDSGGGPDSVIYLIPAGASATGFNNSDWRTQVSIANSTASARTATLHYVMDGAAWPGSVLLNAFQIPSKTSYFMDDLLGPLRPTTGLLYVELDEDGPVVTSRTYNRQSTGATFGQGIPAIRLVSGTAAQELVLPMVHSMPGLFHSNLGIVQASAGTMTVQIEIYSPDGAVIASGTRTVNDAWEQINDVFSVMGAGGANVLGAWVSVKLVGGSPDAWTCYASVVDKVTGDPTYVIGVEPQ